MNPMWMILAALAGVSVLFVAFVIQHRVAQHRKALGPMPPMCTTDEHITMPPPARQVLSRDALVNPNRTLNVHAWGYTPDASGPTDLDGTFDADLDPYVVDRDFLAKRSRGEH